MVDRRKGIATHEIIDLNTARVGTPGQIVSYQIHNHEVFGVLLDMGPQRLGLLEVDAGVG